MTGDEESKGSNVPKVPRIKGNKRQNANPDNEATRKIPKISVESSPIKPDPEGLVKDTFDVALVKQNG